MTWLICSQWAGWTSRAKPTFTVDSQILVESFFFFFSFFMAAAAGLEVRTKKRKNPAQSTLTGVCTPPISPSRRCVGVSRNRRFLSQNIRWSLTARRGAHVTRSARTGQSQHSTLKCLKWLHRSSAPSPSEADCTQQTSRSKKTQAAVDYLAKNMALATTFRDSFYCHVFWTLG